MKSKHSFDTCNVNYLNESGFVKTSNKLSAVIHNFLDY